MKNAVVITDAPRINYTHNYVRLPYYYPSPRYFERPDVKAIRETVCQNLDTLNQATGFAERFKGRKVLVKPNLVAVMLNCGYALDQIPQTTDPRVFEAVVSYLSDLGCEITIVEGSGKGVSTMQYFKDIGVDRVARHYQTGLVALEEQPIDHYYVPKAEVQQDVWLPRIFSQIVEGEALYVSVPKMKTNLYTGVTLGFKNAMGTLPGNMRYRNHSWQIEKKLVDLLYLYKPDLTVIDGIIGGEGCTPAPVDPVKVGMIVSGTNSVEVDRVTTRIMGIDPDELALMKEAKVRGFGAPDVQVIGTPRVVPFRRAESSFLTPRFRKNWPNVRYFVGHTNERTRHIEDIHAVTPEVVYEIEGSCRGGCLATMSTCMETANKGKNCDHSKALGVVLGNGCEVDGERYWFDADGNPYTVDDLKTLDLEVMMGIGTCTAPAYAACTHTGGGCGNVGEVLAMFMKDAKMDLPMLSVDNDQIGLLLLGMIKKYFAVRKVLKQGDIVDIPFDATSDQIFAIPKLSEADQQKDWIYVATPKQTPAQIRQNIKALKVIQIG